MKIDDFINSYDEAIKCLKWLNNTAEDSFIYTCYAYIYTTSGEFSFTIGERKSTVANSETCIRVKNYVDDELINMDVIDIASVTSVRYTFIGTKE